MESWVMISKISFGPHGYVTSLDSSSFKILPLKKKKKWKAY